MKDLMGLIVAILILVASRASADNLGKKMPLQNLPLQSAESPPANQDSAPPLTPSSTGKFLK
ncbi:MAG: hypothetical protein NW237_11900 [Cyanobacteriota bacterium]|nr:hypothetical protein [Cyanobacteriota bacterium]